MTVETHTNKESFEAVKFLVVAALTNGSIGGLIVAVVDVSATAITRIAAGFFVLLVCLFSLLVIGSIRERKEYWLGALHANQSECIGRVLGISIFGSLFAATLFMLSLLGIPYLFGHAFSPDLTDSLRGLFSIVNLLVMVLITSASGVLTLFLLKSQS